MNDSVPQDRVDEHVQLLRALAGIRHGIGQTAHTLFGWIPGIGGASGGLVTPHGIRRYQLGGPVGSDNVLGWLSAGEGILNRTAMAQLGVGGLAAINARQPAIQLHPGTVNVRVAIDGRQVARAIAQYTLMKGAGGTSAAVGGSLLTAHSLTGP